jgi:hypothetical protein
MRASGQSGAGRWAIANFTGMRIPLYADEFAQLSDRPHVDQIDRRIIEGRSPERTGAGRGARCYDIISTFEKRITAVMRRKAAGRGGIIGHTKRTHRGLNCGDNRCSTPWLKMSSTSPNTTTCRTSSNDRMLSLRRERVIVALPEDHPLGERSAGGWPDEFFFRRAARKGRRLRSSKLTSGGSLRVRKPDKRSRALLSAPLPLGPFLVDRYGWPM